MRLQRQFTNCRYSGRLSQIVGCLIPATGFYEWQKREDGKQPYRFRRKDLEPFAFAGVWEFAQVQSAAKGEKLIVLTQVRCANLLNRKRR